MRTLNRPMFRYGGPIKEGVMSGIREPHRNGQRVGAGLVGDQRYPRTDGREHHWAFMPWLLGTGARLIGGQAVKKVGQQGVKKIIQGSTPANMRGIFDVGSKKVVDKGIPAAATGWKNIGKNWFSGDPSVKGAKWGWKTITSPTANTWAQKGVKMATSPSSILIGGLWYANGKWFNKDGSPANENAIAQAKASTGGPPGGGDPGMQGTGEWFAEQADKEAKIAEQKAWKKRIQKYRDIMDIKGMNKDAAYKSLIDASKLIQESGDFKGDIKSGKLINQVIQAASKQFEKPAKTRDAIDTLILKGEIEKDLNKEKNALQNQYIRSNIAKNEAVLAQDSLEGDIRTYVTKQGALPAGNMLANFARSRGYDIKGVEDTTVVKKWMKSNDGNEVDYFQDIITDTEVAPGIYVINNRLLNVDENKRITPVG